MKLPSTLRTIERAAMLVAIAVFTTSVFAQPAPTFKGHQIGESVMDFLTVEARHPLIDGLPVIPKCETKKELKSDQCKVLAELQSGVDKYLAPAYFNVSNTGHFIGGKLVEISFSVYSLEASAPQVITDLTKKMGEPTEQGIAQYQNGFGATFNFPWAMWTTESITVLAKQSERDSIAVSVSNTSWFEKQTEKQEASRRNSTD